MPKTKSEWLCHTLMEFVMLSAIRIGNGEPLSYDEKNAFKKGKKVTKKYCSKDFDNFIDNILHS